MRAEIGNALEGLVDTPYAAAVKDKVLDYVETDASGFTWAPYTLAVDSPDKAFRSRVENVESITTALADSLQSAEKEIIIISPYFVPLNSGIESLVEMKQRGIDIKVITNSLAANNQISVHGGYAPARKPLLEGGVELYEMRPDVAMRGTELAAEEGAISTLHTKAFVVDRQEIFIGSFNFDPRSANINTELGVIIESKKIAAELAEGLSAALPTSTFEVFLNERNQLRWRGFENGMEVHYDKEPRSSWSRRFIAGFMRLLPIRNQL